MDPSPEVASGSLWAINDEVEDDRDGLIGGNSPPFCRLVDATHTGVHSLAFSLAIATNTVQ